MNSCRLALLSLSFVCMSLPAQEVATTSSGRKILVFSDGTWKPTEKTSELATVGGFVRSPQATSKVSIDHGQCSVYYIPTKWKLKSPETSGRTSFEHSDGDGYAMTISERIQIPLDTLKGVALSNAREAAPDAVITAEERRTVNGRTVLMLQIKGTLQKIPFQYFGYYYSGPEGSLQVITYTSQNLFNEYKHDFEEFLNGLVIEP